MKKLKAVILVIAVAVTIASCTQNQRARNFGGTETVNLAKGQRLVIATWKQDNLWYLTEPMPADYIPQKKEFIENSSYGLMEGKVVFIESK